jgi:hypothetical protein
VAFGLPVELLMYFADDGFDSREDECNRQDAKIAKVEKTKFIFFLGVLCALYVQTSTYCFY